MDAKTIITELGGYRAVADALNLRPMRVHNWTRRGIASEFWPDVVALPAAKAKGITFDALKASKVPAKPKSSERRRSPGCSASSAGDAR